MFVLGQIHGDALLWVGSVYKDHSLNIIIFYRGQDITTMSLSNIIKKQTDDKQPPQAINKESEQTENLIMESLIKALVNKQVNAYTETEELDTKTPIQIPGPPPLVRQQTKQVFG